ncbi:hypothetical protein EI94DRAFT_1744306 [Lactarius quietus]|nr:hypothetical protein EI94DRAFT_1744306 [Lactarius quietus]
MDRQRRYQTRHLSKYTFYGITLPRSLPMELEFAMYPPQSPNCHPVTHNHSELWPGQCQRHA